jgi:hypothetical protein
MGALLSAPKNAPAWRTETTFEEMAFVLDTMGFPSGPNSPKCFRKYVCYCAFAKYI